MSQTHLRAPNPPRARPTEHFGSRRAKRSCGSARVPEHDLVNPRVRALVRCFPDAYGTQLPRARPSSAPTAAPSLGCGSGRRVTLACLGLARARAPRWQDERQRARTSRSFDAAHASHLARASIRLLAEVSETRPRSAALEWLPAEQHPLAAISRLPDRVCAPFEIWYDHTRLLRRLCTRNAHLRKCQKSRLPTALLTCARSRGRANSRMGAPGPSERAAPGGRGVFAWRARARAVVRGRGGIGRRR